MFSEEAPFNVVDYEAQAVDDQQGGDVIEVARKVRLTISKASVRPSKDGALARLAITTKIGPLGIDGDGKYANKTLMPSVCELLFYIRPGDERYTSDWWQKNSRHAYKQWLVAMGLDPKNPPKVNDDFLASLAGKEFVADVLKPEIKVKNDEGKYVGTGDFKNELSNFRKAE